MNEGHIFSSETMESCQWTHHNCFTFQAKISCFAKPAIGKCSIPLGNFKNRKNKNENTIESEFILRT